MNDDTPELVSKSLAGLWDFGDPKASGERFEQLRSRAAESNLDELAAMASTQIARSLGLQRSFEDGAAILESVLIDHPKPCGELAVRIDLERGRLLNSSGDKGASIAHFVSAWDEARKAKLDGLAVDAAHMLGIVVEGAGGMEWNERALELAVSSNQPAANKWQGSLYNNMGWSYHEAGNFDRALELFEGALGLRIEDQEAGPIRIARWCIGRCLRSLDRIDEALAIQRMLERDPDADGYVYEELGECLLIQCKSDEAKQYFIKAYEKLSADPWLVANESDRLNRLNNLGSD